MAKKASAPVVSETEKQQFKNNTAFFRDYWTRNKTWRPWSDEVKAEMALLMSKTNLTPGASDNQYWKNMAVEAGVYQPRERGQRAAGNGAATAAKRSGKAISFITFAERIAETQIPLDSLTEAIELVGECESVSQAKDYLDKWSNVLAKCNGDISKAQEIVAIFG